MSLRLPPLPLLRLFESAGRQQSFKLAAEELGVTASAVSHGIKTLEAWLGVGLFRRKPGGISLTGAGRDYLPYVSKALCMIATGTRAISAEADRRQVRLSCAPTFASRILMPALEEFRHSYPGLGVALDTAHEYVLTGADIDLAIRMARRPGAPLAPQRLLNEILVPVCSPSYLQSHFGSRGRIDLSRATLLHVSTVTEDWSKWLQAAGLGHVDLAAGLYFDEIQLAFGAAVAGLGVAMGRRPLVDAELRAGVLVQAHELTVASTTGGFRASKGKAGGGRLPGLAYGPHEGAEGRHQSSTHRRMSETRLPAGCSSSSMQ